MSNKAEFIRLRRLIMERDFSRMNDMQRQAVFCTQGPLLILAGAGSGKTTVLVNRFANLVKYGRAYESEQVPDGITDSDLAAMRAAADKTADDGQMSHALSLCPVDPCPAWRILAVTFTNKAAGELKERLAEMLGAERAREAQASTFHSFCAQILRRYGDRIGFSSHFTIYDSDDSARLMKDCLKTLNISESTLGHKAVISEIGRAKDRLLSPDMYKAETGYDYRKRQIGDAYELYQSRLKQADAMDFDDLLYMTVKLFEKEPDVLTYYQNRFCYIMVDEYQDTNHAQYRFISMLSERCGNLCVVGDDDQSIYKFRGATVENILEFERQFKGCRVIRLEQNYRSTQNILDAANAVISKNENRKGKTLWTNNKKGEKIDVHTLDNEDEEGRFIADTILEGMAKGRKYGDFTVLYRVNAQSNALERTLMKSGIPYRIIGGHRFFDRMEIRDATAYLRLINNTSDSMALQRVINRPKRGIGDITLDRAMSIADGLGISLYEVISHADNYADISRAAVKLKSFTDMIDGLRELNDNPEISIHELYKTMLKNTGYLEMWEQAGEIEAGRVENLNELASSIIDYEKNNADGGPDLAGFLEEVALMTDVDNYDAHSDSVALMTMHAAKGLEFPVVFLPGFEEGIFPGMRTLFEPEELEEDRRLCYVAITRAKEKIYISNAKSRMLYGSVNRNLPSRFLYDIPNELINVHERQSSAQLYNTHKAVRRTFSISDIAGGGISALNKAENRPKTEPVKWEEGDMVSHELFGEGQILSFTPMSNDTLLEIRFKKSGVKKIMANYAHLTKLTR